MLIREIKTVQRYIITSFSILSIVLAPLKSVICIHIMRHKHVYISDKDAIRN